MKGLFVFHVNKRLLTKIAFAQTFLVVSLIGVAMLLAQSVPVAANAGGGGDGGVERAFKRSSTAKKRTSKKKAVKTRRKRQVKRKRKVRFASRRAVRQRPSNPGQLLISYAADTPPGEITRLAQTSGLREIARVRLDWLGTIVVKYSTRRPLGRAALRRLRADTRTEIVQPNFRYFLAQGAARQYALKMLRFDKISKLSSGDGVKIVILDSGVYDRHPVLAGVVRDSFDPIGKGRRVDFDHGTAMASIIAARKTMTGMSPKASVLSVRVFAPLKKRSSRARGQFAETYNLILGVDWAVRNKANIVNMSFAGSSKDELFGSVIKGASQKGLIFVAAAGNLGPSKPVTYPAAFKEVIAVTAVDAKRRLYWKANRGGQIALSAPGVNILVARKKRSLGLMSGTSAATAYVSGTIALILQKSPGLTTTEVLAKLAKTARDLGKKGRDKKYGFGLVDPLKALAEQN